MVFLPYAAIVVIGAIYLRREQVTPFFRRFGMALGAFMVATALFYLYIVTVAKTAAVDVSLIGHAWRIGLMLAIGSCLSAAVAQLTARAHARARRAAPSPRT
jgi:glucose uptake protein GlcU